MKIFLNGQAADIFCKSAFMVRDEYFKKESLVILNGFQISEDGLLQDGDELFIIEKGEFPPENQLEAMMAARHTPGIHKKIKQAKVAIAGLGGLGSNIAVSLARIGVGQLFLIDYDIVEPSNLNRQNYYIRHLGMFKTDALKEQLCDINPFIDVRTQTVLLDKTNIPPLFDGYPIVCEALDHPHSKAMLVNTLLETLPNVTIVAASGMAGYDSSNSIRTNRMTDRLYVCGDLVNEAKVGNGLMAPRVQICAGHQANMVLRLILGAEGA